MHLFFNALLMSVPTLAQTFNSASSGETTYPSTALAPSYYLDEDISYLHNSSIYTPLLYAPPILSGTASVASWSHKMYINSFGLSATDGGGFSLGALDLSGNYTGLILTAMPNASNICAATVHGLCQENVIVVYAQPCADDLTEGCNPMCNYYYQLYHWVHPFSLTPIGSPVALSSCSFFDRISIDINGEGDKAVVVWGHNNSTIFSKAFDFSGSTLAIGPTVYITTKGNLADVAFRKDPSSGTEYLHYGYFSYLYRTECEFEFHNDEDLGLLHPTFIHGQTTFSDIMNGTFTSLTNMNYEPSYLAGLVDDVNLIIDAPDEYSDPNWSYTWSEKGGSDAYVRTYKDGVSLPLDPSWIANNGITPSGTLPRYTSASLPTIGYHPNGANYFSGFVGGPNGYIADQINDIGTLMSANDYLNVPNNSFASGIHPLVSFSKNSSGDYLYSVFGQKDAMGNYSLIHKGHPWTSTSTWRKTDPNALSTLSENQETNLYPVPFDKEINLSVPHLLINEQWKLNITDVLGKSIANIYGTATQINSELKKIVQDLNSGTYILYTIDPHGNKKHFKATKQ